MEFLNIEIKAKCTNPAETEAILREKGADFKGIDHQKDTYFKTPKGRLKLREGNIENALIHYHRPDQAGPKASDVTLFRTAEPGLKEVLLNALEKLTVVDKTRKIFFIENVKFHIDHVEGLGDFVEIEAIDYEGNLGRAHLLAQCEEWISLLNIQQAHLLTTSYSDMIMKYERQTE